MVSLRFVLLTESICEFPSRKDNRTRHKVGATTYDHGAANARNQLTGYGMTYDNSGNLLTQTDPETGAKYAYVWDSINRLLEIKVDKNGNGSYGIGDSKTEFAYDGLSRRYRQKDYIPSGGSWSLSQTTHFLWCGGEICQKRVGGTSYTSVKANYYGSGESRHTSHTNKTSHFYTKDHLGSVREVTSGSGSSITMNTAFDCSPYGVRTCAPNPGGADPWKAEFGYTGHFFHAPSGTHLAWFRGYDPRIGRWLNADPLAENGGLNVYAYCFGNPLPSLDVDGLRPGPAANFAGGMGDSLTFGITKGIRKALIKGISDLMDLEEAGTDNDGTDPCSGAYAVGQGVGTALGLASGMGGITSATRLAKALGSAPHAVRGAAAEAMVLRRAGAGVRGQVSMSIAGRGRRLDGLSNAKLIEVKHVRSQSYTRQLRDYQGHASSNGLQMELYTRGSTALSGPLREAIQRGDIAHKTIPFGREAFETLGIPFGLSGGATLMGGRRCD